jgi:parallel beta-helix repeat protein
MTDFQAFNATSYQIIRLEDDYNNILHHAFEKTAKYVVRKNSSYYEAIQGGTSSGAGTIAFGGAGNAGSTDGTSFHAVIEAAINSGSGGRVHIRGGDYALDDTIDVGQSNTWISGEGNDTVITQATADKHAFSFTTKSGCRLSSLYLYGTGADTGSGVYATTNSANLYVDHVKIENWGYHGIHIINCTQINLSQNWVFNNIRNGLLLDTCDNASVTQNMITTNTRHGIELDDCSYGLIRGNHILMNDLADAATYDGLILLHSADSSDYNLIQGNHIRDNDRYEINISTASCTGNKIGVNMLYGTDREGIVNDAGTSTEYPIVKRCATSVDLSGAASTLVVFHPESAHYLIRATLLYTEASSADAGITVEIGKETDRDYYYTGTTEVNKAQWYTNTVTLLQDDVAAGDTVTFYSAGGKVGTGEIILITDYV